MAVYVWDAWVGNACQVTSRPGVPARFTATHSVASWSPERAGRLTATGTDRIGHELEA